MKAKEIQNKDIILNLTTNSRISKTLSQTSAKTYLNVAQAQAHKPRNFKRTSQKWT